MVGAEWPADLPQIIYVDDFGNAISGLRASSYVDLDRLAVNGTRIQRALTFSEVAVGIPFWYENSHGLIEIAVNQGNASQQLQIGIGSLIETKQEGS
ncbi:MAG: SAM-dependent chlorinase/fluorinase, partial [Gammaproteobacteria bacterium]|nr:SAM-dependent chlorinase/fluorinase [Gammaproteobacteria bacterium]